jgi:hypothetical protein
MFRVVLPPIIRSAYTCIYSIWYLSHPYCYLTLSWKSWDRFECAVGGVRILLYIYCNILTMHGPINVKSPNNISKWQMGFNSAFKRLMYRANNQSGRLNCSTVGYCSVHICTADFTSRPKRKDASFRAYSAQIFTTRCI